MFCLFRYHINETPTDAVFWTWLILLQMMHLRFICVIHVSVVHSFLCWFVACSNEKAMAPHSSTLAWKIPWTEEPGGLQSRGSLRVRHDCATLLSLFTFPALEKEMAAHSSVLAWRIPPVYGVTQSLIQLGSSSSSLFYGCTTCV